MDGQPRGEGRGFEPPLGIMGSLGATFRVYLSNINTLLLIVAIFVIPVTIVTTIMLHLTIPEEFLTFEASREANPFEDVSFEDLRGLVAVGIITFILSFVITMIAVGACFKAINDALTGHKPEWRASIRAALEKTGALVWLPLLMGLLGIGAGIAGIVIVGLLTAVAEPLAGIGILALLAGFIYVFVSWSLAIPVLMSEDRRGMAALSRSRELVRGRWWQTFAVYALTFLVIIVISAILGEIFNVGGRTGDEGLVLTTLFNVVSNVVFTPFEAALVGVIYLNLKVQEQPSATDALPSS